MTGRDGLVGPTGAGAQLAALEPGTPVTVRHRVPDPRADPESSAPPLLADVVATVVAVGAERIELRRGDGTSVSVRLDRVTAVRLLPRPPGVGRPADPLGLARVAGAGWPATEQEWLGNWLLRAAGGWTRRANSALALGPPGRPLAAALTEVGGWYAARGLAPVLSVPQLAASGAAGGRGAGADAGGGGDGGDAGGGGSRGGAAGAGGGGLPGPVALEAAGWLPAGSTLVMVARSADVLAAADPADTRRAAVRLSPMPGPAWLADYRDAATHPGAAAVLAGPPEPARVRFAELPWAAHPDRTDTDELARRPGLAARGRAVTLDGWIGLTAVGVAAECRRTGAGRWLVSALLADGLRHGGVRSYVEVEQDNAGALTFWERLGYRRSHESVYYRLGM